MRYHCVAGSMSVMSNTPAARSVGGGGNSSAKTVACRHTCEAQRHVLKSLLFVLQGRQRRALAESIIGCDQERQHRPEESKAEALVANAMNERRYHVQSDARIAPEVFSPSAVWASSQITIV